MVVLSTSVPAHRLDQAAYEAVGAHTVPLDIVVMTSQEFERRRLALASLPAAVVREGRVLYAA